MACSKFVSFILDSLSSFLGEARGVGYRPPHQMTRSRFQSTKAGREPKLASVPDRA